MASSSLQAAQSAYQAASGQTKDGFFGGIENWWTGNTDWERQVAGSMAEMAYNSAEAQANRNWQERMSNTAYQRQVADMKAAGLNPYANTAHGASTPSGGAARASGARGTASGGQGAAQVAGGLMKLASSAMSLAIPGFSAGAGVGRALANAGIKTAKKAEKEWRKQARDMNARFMSLRPEDI
mgnify:CR=1 FL=1|jgi:hypothetical protein